MKIPKSHPRYKSLKTRESLSRLADDGIVAKTGLIAHGRGEALDYFLGERTVPEAELAIKVAAYWLTAAKRPVLSVNGNVAALAGKAMVALSRAVPAPIEINLFHRSPQRLALVAGHMRKLGARELLGIDARKRLPGLAQPRSWCSEEGIYSADAVLVSLEDGDRAQALKRAGKFVIAIDLNPLSRTAVEADVTIVDEVTRAVPLLTRFVRCARSRPAEYSKLSRKFDNRANLSAVKARMARRLAED